MESFVSHLQQLVKSVCRLRLKQQGKYSDVRRNSMPFKVLPIYVVFGKKCHYKRTTTEANYRLKIQT
jgi:hypothetical protein